INGNGVDRIFDIFNATPASTVVTVNISGLTLTNGSTGGDGGAIETDDAKLTISNCVFSGNVAIAGEGGAIYSDGFYSTLTVKDSVFTGNSAGYEGGAIYVDDTSEVAARGVHISNSRFIGANTADEGGAIYLDDVDSPVLIENSVIDGNTAAVSFGGGIAIDDTDNRGTVTIRNSTISNNTATTDGGGVFMDDPDNQVLIDNSTLSGNNASGAANTGQGGGIYVDYSNNFVRLRNTTVASNYATDEGGGIYLYGLSGYSQYQTLMLQNTVVADNYAANSGPDLRENEGRFLAEFSMIGNTSGAGVLVNLPGQGTNGGNINDVNPNLGNLENNGGSSKTNALDFFSSPLDRGSNSICTAASGATTAALVRDQRGVFRP
ncbi:MAG: right-handed parallel beta-helix repeat-containing protein, partial [Nevskiales bacterium]